jgi:hypothetical protein
VATKVMLVAPLASSAPGGGVHGAAGDDSERLAGEVAFAKLCVKTVEAQPLREMVGQARLPCQVAESPEPGAVNAPPRMQVSSPLTVLNRRQGQRRDSAELRLRYDRRPKLRTTVET